MNYYTHAGLFHADEVTGYAICEMAGICCSFERITDFNNIPTDGLVADIGRVYDPSKKLFDHHQEMIYREDGYPYASAGLLWKEYGYYAVFNTIGEEENPDLINKIVKRVDNTLIKGLDAMDSDNAFKMKAQCSGGYLRLMTLSDVISDFNQDDVKDQESQREAFEKASELISIIIQKKILSAKSFFENEEKFKDLVSVSEDGKLLILQESLRWREIVHKQYPDALYIIMPSNHPANPYSMFAVSVDPSSRELKKSIERPSWFEGFIHNGKWIAAGNSVGELTKLAKYNIKRNNYIVTGGGNLKYLISIWIKKLLKKVY